jgi:phage terminase small subunit
MPGGRKPTPTVLAELHGNPRQRGGHPKRPLPVPIGDLDAVPEHFSEAQGAIWKYAIDHAPPGLLKRIDAGALMAWVMANDLHRQAVIAQNELGTLVVKSPNVQMEIQSPYLAIINRQALIMLRAASELGFSPTSRPRAYALPVPGEGFHARTEIDEKAVPPRASRISLDDYLAEGGPLN